MISMKKKIIIIVVSLFLGLIILGSMHIGLSIYRNEYKLTDKGTELSPNDSFAVVFQMVGVPDWPFGSTHIKVTVKDTKSNETIKIIDTYIQDDGATLRKENWYVVWQSDSVEITLKGSEQEDSVYTIQL